MSKLIVTAVAALSMLFVGIRALSFRSDATDDLGLSGADAQAAGFLDSVLGGGATALGISLPALFAVAIFTLLLGFLALTR